MPKILLEVSDAWIERLQEVMPAAIDTLQGIEHQIRSCLMEGTAQADALLEQLHPQLTALRRSLESARIIF